MIIFKLKAIFSLIFAVTSAETDLIAGPKECPKNETLVHRPPCPPEHSCATYLSGIAFDCADVDEDCFTDQCNCKPGLIRRYIDIENGECINPNECCYDPNAEVVDCPNPCPGGSCDQPEFVPCDMACPFKGCQCKEGFLKNHRRICVPIDECSIRDCGENQRFEECGTACPKVCGQPPTPAVCIEECVKDCFCIPGFILHEGQCISEEECDTLCGDEFNNN